MKSVVVNRFELGMAESRGGRALGECGVSKHFDVSTFPYKIVPYRGMAANVTGQSRIGNLLIASNGIPHGMGTIADNNDNGKLYNKATIAGDWTAMSNDTSGAVQGSFRMLTEFQSNIYHSYGVKSAGALNDGSGAGIWWTAIDNGSSSSQAFSSGKNYVSNGVVHPATGYLYVGHDNLVAQITAVGSGYTDAALTLPSNATIISIAPFGNYLAIAARIGSSVYPQCKVFLWDVVSALTIWSESIDWPGDLQTIHDYQGYLIGVSALGNTAYTLDRSGISIYAYSLGGIPRKIRELSTERQTTTLPTAQVNPNVSFIFNNKFYFSADLVGGSTSPKYYGLWSLSRSPVNGNAWCVTIEQGATSGNTETSVLAAAKLADYVWMVHTAIGTVTRNIDNSDGDFSSTTFNGPSFYETVVNPEMEEGDYHVNKGLVAVNILAYFPGATSQITMYYRADRASAWSSAIFNKTTSTPDDDTAGYRQTLLSVQGRYFEFRFESIGAAELNGYGYDYDPSPMT